MIVEVEGVAHRAVDAALGGEAADHQGVDPQAPQHRVEVDVVAARVGQSLLRGDMLVTLEAMKMETTVRAEQDGVIKEVLAKPGQAVDAKDLLVVFE